MAIVTISRGVHCGGAELANAVAKKLGHTAVGREVILDSARKFNIMAEDLERDVARVPSIFERLTRESNRYVVFVKAALLAAVQEGNLVYYGVAGQVFLPNVSHVLKVRLIAPMEKRVERLIAAHGGDPAAAEAQILQADKERSKWTRVLYDQDWHDPSLYDLTLNLANTDLDSAAEIVAHAARQPAFEPTQASLQRLTNLRIEAEVLAALAADDKLWDERLEATVAGGEVTVRGYVRSDAQKQLIEELVQHVKGVQGVKVYVGKPADGFGRGSP